MLSWFESKSGSTSAGSVQALIQMRNWYTYILLCDQKTFYVGMTNDFRRRLNEHKKKESFFTKKFSEVQLVYVEKYGSEKESVDREKQIKGWSRAKKQKLLNGELGINRIELVEVLDGEG